MYLFSALLFSLSANIDSLIIGASYGIRHIRLSIAKCLLIGLVTLGGTLAALLLGRQILAFFPSPLTQWIGNILLIALGIYYVVKALYSRKRTGETPSIQKQSKAQTLSVKECLLLGAALSVNNLGIGISASITGMALFPAAPVSFVISALFLYLGNTFGRCFGSRISDSYADLISGGILILLGIYGFF